MTYFTQIREYEMLATDPQIFTQPPLTKPSLKAYDQARQIINVSIGVMEALRDGLSLLAGARTDLNSSTDSFLDSDKFVPKMSYWNLYHITGGVVWFNEKSHVTLGGDYAFGVSKGDLQQVNLSDPTESGLLFGEKTTDTKTFYNQINVVLGFSYSF